MGTIADDILEAISNGTNAVVKAMRELIVGNRSTAIAPRSTVGIMFILF